MCSQKEHKSKYITSALITAILLIYLILSGPASAILVQIAGISDIIDKGGLVPFNISIKIDAIETLPFMHTRILLNASGESYDNICYIYSNQTSNCSYLSVSAIESTPSLNYSYGSGYGYDIENESYYNSGAGYGYGYNSTEGNITIRLIMNTTDMPVGPVTLKAEIFSGNDSDYHIFSSNTTQFTITCTENWTYSAWSACSCTTSTRTRTASDLNSCGTTENRSTLTESCTPTGCSTSSSGGSSGSHSIPVTTKKTAPDCTEQWNCSEWSACTEDGTQARTCSDTNDCGTADNISITSQSCTYEEDNITEEKTTLFDINIELTEDEFIVDSESEESLKNELLGKVTLINFGDEGSVDANIHYTIKDKDGNIVYDKKETVDVETQNEFLKDFDISILPAGEYTLHLDLAYEGQKEPAQTEKVFVIKEKEKGSLFIIVILFLVCLCVIIYKYRTVILFLIFGKRKKKEEDKDEEIKHLRQAVIYGQELVLGINKHIMAQEKTEGLPAEDEFKAEDDDIQKDAQEVPEHTENEPKDELEALINKFEEAVNKANEARVSDPGDFDNSVPLDNDSEQLDNKNTDKEEEKAQQ